MRVNKKDFNEEAKRWDSDETRRNLALGLADAIAKRLDLKGSETLLDYGAGTGIVALKLSPLVKEVLCADSSRGMLEVIEDKLKKVPQARVRTRLLDLEHEQPDFAVDALTSTMTLHHIEDIGTLFCSFFNLLRPGSPIALADLDTEPGDFHSDNAGVHHFGFDRNYLRGMLTAAGFVDVEVATAYTIHKERSEGQASYPVFLFTGRKPAR
jgi:ubiquinone/menaquinone biosynthesis C-methylase UbiE